MFQGNTSHLWNGTTRLNDSVAWDNARAAKAAKKMLEEGYDLPDSSFVSGITSIGWRRLDKAIDPTSNWVSSKKMAQDKMWVMLNVSKNKNKANWLSRIVFQRSSASEEQLLPIFHVG